MKKQLIILLLVFGSFMAAKAQNFGFKALAGANFCQIDGDQLGGYNKLGFRFGFGTFIPTAKEDEIGFEITYVQKGSRTANDPDNPPPYIVRYNYNYIEVPLFYKKKIKNFGLKVALVPGLLVSGRSDLGGGFTDDPFVRPFELSGIIGPEYQVNENWSFYMHYQYSLLSIVNLQPSQVPGSGFTRRGIYNNLISAGLGYQIR